MYERDAHSPFADCRRNPFDGLVAHVAGDEDTGHTGLEHVWCARQAPAFGSGSITDQISASQDEASTVSLNDIAQPLRVRHSADKDEHTAAARTVVLV